MNICILFESITHTFFQFVLYAFENGLQSMKSWCYSEMFLVQDYLKDETLTKIGKHVPKIGRVQ